jgi:hypothetical protein
MLPRSAGAAKWIELLHGQEMEVASSATDCTPSKTNRKSPNLPTGLTLPGLREVEALVDR